MNHQGIHDHKGKRLRVQPAFIPGVDHRIQLLAEGGDGRFAELLAAHLFGDAADLACGHAIDHHLHQRHH